MKLSNILEQTHTALAKEWVDGQGDVLVVLSSGSAAGDHVLRENPFVSCIDRSQHLINNAMSDRKRRGDETETVQEDALLFLVVVMMMLMCGQSVAMLRNNSVQPATSGGYIGRCYLPISTHIEGIMIFLAYSG